MSQDEDKDYVKSCGLHRSIFLRGIGGSNFTEIESLHSHYAHFLATSHNIVGRRIHDILEHSGYLQTREKLPQLRRIHHDSVPIDGIRVEQPMLSISREGKSISLSKNDSIKSGDSLDKKRKSTLRIEHQWKIQKLPIQLACLGHWVNVQTL